MHIRCRQYKYSVWWGLFQRLEQGVKCLGGQHMRLVKHVHLVLPGRRRHHDFFTQVTNAVYTSIGGRVDLDDVEGVARGNLTALLAHVAWLTIDRSATIDRFCQQTRGAGFACSPRSREEVGMGKFTAAERVFERANDGFLTNEITESLRTPFSVAIVKMRTWYTNSACIP